MSRMVLLLVIALCFPVLLHGRELEESDHGLRITAPTRYPLVCDPSSMKAMLDFKDRIDSGVALTAEEEVNLRKTLGDLDESCLRQEIKQALQVAFRRSQQFPCDVSKITHPIKIVISPELHAQGHEKEQAEYNIREVTEIMRRVREGKALAAFESNLDRELITAEDRKSGTVDPYADGKDAHAITGMALTNYESAENLIPILDLVHSISRSELLLASWKDIKRPFSDPGLEKHAELVDKLIPTYTTALTKAMSENDPKELDALIETYRKLGYGKNAGRALSLEILKGALILVSKKENKFATIPPEVSGDFSQENIDKFSDSLLKEVTIKWRDRNMAGSASELICQAIKKGADTVFLRQGGGHTVGSIELLNSFIKRSGAENKIEVMVDSSFDRSPIVKQIVKQQIDYGIAKGIGKEVVSIWGSLQRYPRWKP